MARCSERRGALNTRAESGCCCSEGNGVEDEWKKLKSDGKSIPRLMLYSFFCDQLDGSGDDETTGFTKISRRRVRPSNPLNNFGLDEPLRCCMITRSKRKGWRAEQVEIECQIFGR